MSQNKYKLNVALHAFLTAFHKYQEATLKMHQSVERLNRSQIALCEPLKFIIEKTGTATRARDFRSDRVFRNETRRPLTKTNA